MAIAHLDGDQLAASIASLVNNYSPHRVGYEELSASLTDFLRPLTHEGLDRAHMKTVLSLAEDWLECDREAHSPFAHAEENAGAYRRHTTKAYQKLRVACMAICEGGTP